MARKNIASGIYAIHCTAKEKIYIGNSTNIAARWSTHLHDLKKGTHHNIHLQRAFNKYGEASLKLEILELLLPIPEVLSDAELKWSDKFRSYDRRVGFNLTKDTSAPPRFLGSTHPNSKLTDEDIPLIVKKFLDGESITDIAKDYGISRANINAILYGKTWLHIERRIFTPKTMKKLTDSDVAEIHEKLLAGEIYSKIAQDYAVSPTTIIAIVQGKVWRYVEAATDIKPRNLGKKLTEKDVVEIKNRILAGETNTAIAKSYGVSAGAVDSIKHNRSWKHVAPEINVTGCVSNQGDLTVEQVAEIKRRIVAGESPPKIAKDYGVDRRTISSIRCGRLWKHVDPEINVASCVSKRGELMLTVEQVAEIKRRIVAGESPPKIAKDYGVTHGTISSIRCNRRWKHVLPS